MNEFSRTWLKLGLIWFMISFAFGLLVWKYDVQTNTLRAVFMGVVGGFLWAKAQLHRK